MSDVASTEVGQLSSMQEQGQNVETQNTATIQDAEVLEAQQAIAEAVQYANESIVAGDAGSGVEMIKSKELSVEERRSLSRSLARKQRELGMREFERVYPNTIVVPADITIGDPNIASSARRFLGLLDRTLYLFYRLAPRYMGAVEFEKVRIVIEKQISEYIQEAKATLDQGRELVERAKSAAELNGDPWFEPKYTTTTLNINFGVKTRQVLGVVRALQQWDQAVVLFAALDFNGEGEVNQIMTLRQRERRLFQAINRTCLRTIYHLNRRNQALAGVKAEADAQTKSEGNGEAVAAGA